MFSNKTKPRRRKTNQEHKPSSNEMRFLHFCIKRSLAVWKVKVCYTLCENYIPPSYLSKLAVHVLSISKHVKAKEYQNFVLCTNAKFLFCFSWVFCTLNFQRLSFVLLENTDEYLNFLVFLRADLSLSKKLCKSYKGERFGLLK